MRLVLVVVVCMLLPLAPGAARAQAPPGGSAHLLSDEKGDTVLETGAPGVAGAPFAVAGQTDAADLVGLDAVEQEDAFSFVVSVASLKGTLGTTIVIDFGWRDVEYYVTTQYANNAFGSFQQSVLMRNGEDGLERAGVLNLTVDVEKGTLTSLVPKVYLLDGAKRTPGLGDQLHDIKVSAEAAGFRFSIEDQHPLAVHDDMPNAGGTPATLTFQRGDYQSGHVFLTTDDRVRVSNGGATTFVFQAKVANNGTADDDIKLSVGELPESWNATVQSPVRVPSGQSRTVAVLVSVPFAHVHGGYSSFNLTATSSRDASSMAVLRLGVLHTPIPQPAGHHSELFLHGVDENTGVFAQLFPFTGGYINTESKHDGEPTSVNPNSFMGNGNAWKLLLNPTLQIGVDFDMERTGLLEGNVLTHAQGTGSVSAKLYLYEPGDKGKDDGSVLLADSKPQHVTYDLQKPTAFKLVMVPQPDADYIPYAKGQNMGLVISLKDDGFPGSSFCCIAGQTGPQLDVGTFHLTLPLNEYNDQLTGFADVANALDIKADGPVEKTGRPGSIMTYEFDLTNGAGNDMVVQLDVAGNDAKQGSLVPDGEVSLPAHTTKHVTLGVHVPDPAGEGQTLDVLVFAHARDDPSKVAIARTKTTVSHGANATDDESHILLAARDAQNDTPAPGPMLIVGGAALAAVVLRRRRE